MNKYFRYINIQYSSLLLDTNTYKMNIEGGGVNCKLQKRFARETLYMSLFKEDEPVKKHTIRAYFNKFTFQYDPK